MKWLTGLICRFKLADHVWKVVPAGWRVCSRCGFVTPWPSLVNVNKRNV